MKIKNIQSILKKTGSRFSYKTKETPLYIYKAFLGLFVIPYLYDVAWWVGGLKVFDEGTVTQLFSLMISTCTSYFLYSVCGTFFLFD